MPDQTERAVLIDGAIGELSPFHQTFGYYGHGVSDAVATLPEGWRERLIPYQTTNMGSATALCLEVHDLAVSKLVAGREKDLSFIRVLIWRGLADLGTLRDRLAVTKADARILREADLRLAWLEGDKGRA